MNNEASNSATAISDKVRNALTDFFRSLNRELEREIDDDTDLIDGTGATSDEGIDFAIDLGDALGVDVPNDFNPFVHPSGNRGMTFRELVKHAERFIANSGKGHADANK